MSLISALRRVFARTPPDPALVVAIADDGTGPDPDAGQATPLRADPDTGALLVKSVDGAGGGGDASEATLDRVADATEALVETIAAGGTATPGQAAIAVVNVDPAPGFAAAPPAATTAPAVRVVGDGFDRFNEPILRVLVVDTPPVGAVQADAGDPNDPWVFNSVKGGVSVEAASEETSAAILSELLDVATTADVQEVRDRLPSALEGGRLAVETELGATGALATEAKQDDGNLLLTSLDGKVPALVSGRVPVDPSGVTQPVSAAALPLPAGASTSALQGAGLPAALTAGGGVKTGLVDALPAGGNAIGSVTVSASALPSGAAQEHVNAASPHAARLSDGSAFYKGAVAGDNMGADLRVASAAVANGNPVPVSDAGSSLTVDGAVTANVGTTGGLALDATLTGGTQIAQVRGGAKGSTAAAAVTSTAEGSNNQALDVQIYHGGAAKDPTQIRALTVADVVSIGNTPAVKFAREHLGPFGHLIAQPLTFLTQITFTYGINTFQGTTAASGTGATVDTTGGMLRLQSGTGAAGNASYLSSQPLLYRAGQGMGMVWSMAFPAGVANNTTIGGPSTTADNADGYFFGRKGTDFGIHHYRSGSEVSFTSQASWNGTVPAGFDPTKLNLYDVRYPFLGSGDIFFMIQDSTSGDPIVVHTIRYANTSTILEISNPTLKFLARSVNTGNTTNVTALVGSVGKYLVGTRFFNGPTFAFNNQKAVTGGVETNLFSARVATTLNGVANRGAVRVRLGTAVADNGNTIAAFFARLGATVGGTPAFTAYNGSTADNGVTLTSANSMLSFDTAGTTVTGAAAAIAINTGCARNSQVPLDFSNLDVILLPGETWTISALPGANTNCAVFFNGIEEW